MSIVLVGDIEVETDVFPIEFATETSIRTINRLADFWEATGLQTEIQKKGEHYTLILHAPEADT